MADKLTFQTHPLKNDIIARWDNGENNTQIYNWLKKEHLTLVISHATLCKHYARYAFNKKHVESADIQRMEREKKKKKEVPIEVILWETIQQCRKKKKDTTISVKDWQYLDQQLQAAIEKLMRIKTVSGDERDISSFLAEVFSKLEAGHDVELADIKPKELTDDEKLKIAQGVDSEDKVEAPIPPETS